MATIKNATKHLRTNNQRLTNFADQLAFGDDLPDSTLRAIEGKAKRGSAKRDLSRLETLLRDTLTWENQ